MHPGRSGRSLGERAVNSGVGTAAGLDRLGGGRPPPGRRPAAEPPRGDDADGEQPAEGRHCWVRDPPGNPGTWPGLLVEWRQRGGGWQGRVAYTVAGPHGPALVEAWLPAARLQPR
jgi:hypothetical protein